MGKRRNLLVQVLQIFRFGKKEQGMIARTRIAPMSPTGASRKGYNESTYHLVLKVLAGRATSRKRNHSNRSKSKYSCSTIHQVGPE